MAGANYGRRTCQAKFIKSYETQKRIWQARLLYAEQQTQLAFKRDLIKQNAYQENLRRIEESEHTDPDRDQICIPASVADRLRAIK